MKTAVEAVFIGKDRQLNRRFLQMCGHYLIEPVACTPAAGWEKGQVENQVGNIRERLFAPRLRMASHDELNAWLRDQCIAYAKANKHPEQTDRTVWQVFEAERAALVPIGGLFDGFLATQAAVSKTCLVRFDNNKYWSMPAPSAGRSRFRPMPSASSSARTARSSAIIAAASAAARRSTIPGTMCRCWPGSPAR